jgi:glycosyltransferase involved in cell wall biosynthesis
MRNKGEYRASACMQAVKLDFIKNNKIKFIEGIIHEDECYSLEVCLYAKKASHLKKNIYMRRMRDDSIMTSTKSLKRSFGYFKSITCFITHLEGNVEEEYYIYFYNYLRSLQKSSVNYFLECNSKNDAKEFINSLCYSDRCFYKLMIETLADNENKLKDKDNEIKKLNDKLKKQNSIKYLVKQRIKNKAKKGKNIINKVLKKNIKISIIIPVYNCEKYLNECLDSLINQTLKEIEIICVDDESSDKSYSILKEYAKKDNRFRIYKQKHSNAGNARNLGMKKARGKYLLFLDSDDYFDKNLCLKTYNAAKNNKAEIVLFSAVKVNEKTKEKEKVHVLLDKAVVPLNEIYSSTSIAQYLYKSSSSAPWSKLFEKKFIEKNNIKFQSLPNSNDVFFTRLSFSLAKRFYAIDEKLVNYRVNHGTNTQACKYKEPLSFIKAYLKLKEELEKRNLFDKYYQTYLNTLFCEITYNYNSTKTDEGKKQIVEYLKDKGLKELGIDNFDKKLIYEEKKYNEFCEILNIK